MSNAIRPLTIVRSLRELREELDGARAAGSSIGLVPTMGALHEGHLSLIRRSRELCGFTVLSLFVNPSQFNDPGDLSSYPRDEARDARLAAAAGADILFAPTPAEVYPEGFSTSVQVGGLTERLEGAARGPAHFHGVTTVVCKLLAMVRPEVAFFGQKDAQQVIVISRMVADLNLPVRIESCPIVREPDGLAMSSRNLLLDAEERESARGMPRALRAAAELVARGERDGAAIEAAAASTLAEFGLASDYAELVHPRTLERVGRLEEPALLAIAARAGKVRLIDNTTLVPAPAPDDTREGAPEPCLQRRA